MLPSFQKTRFRNAIKKYDKAKHSNRVKSDTGATSYSDTKELEKAIKKLMRFVKKR